MAKYPGECPRESWEYSFRLFAFTVHCSPFTVHPLSDLLGIEHPALRTQHSFSVYSLPHSLNHVTEES